MILYFSGTGNSAYAAKRIGREIDDKVMNLFEKIKNNDFSELYSKRPWVIVVPTYAWRIPRIVGQWLERTPLTGSTAIYFILTCGENIGNADKYLELLCKKKNMDYYGCFGITMPENYIALFTTPKPKEALHIIEQAEPAIDRAAHDIKGGHRFPKMHMTFKDRLCSGIVNTIFYPVFVHARKFYAANSCISCGKCVNVCPLGNIRLNNGKPVWGKHCTHCMACICRCPKEAIEYGKHSQGLPRYVCKKN